MISSPQSHHYAFLRALVELCRNCLSIRHTPCAVRGIGGFARSSANSLPAECLNGTRQPAQKQHFSTSQQSHPRVFANSSWSSSWPISNLSPSSPLPLGEGQGEGCCEKRTVLISEWESYSHPVRGNAGRQLHCRPNLSRTGQQRIWEVGSLSHADGRIFSPPFHSVDILTANRGRVKWFDAQTSVLIGAVCDEDFEFSKNARQSRPGALPKCEPPAVE